MGQGLLLPALELHQELLERGGGVHTVGILNETFESEESLATAVARWDDGAQDATTAAAGV